MHHAGVVSALRGGGTVRLHADEGEIGGGAEHGAEAAGGEAGASLLHEGEGGSLVLLLEEVDDLGVDAETRGGVGGLAEKTRRETLRGERMRGVRIGAGQRDERERERGGHGRGVVWGE